MRRTKNKSLLPSQKPIKHTFNVNNIRNFNKDCDSYFWGLFTIVWVRILHFYHFSSIFHCISWNFNFCSYIWYIEVAVKFNHINGQHCVEFCCPGLMAMVYCWKLCLTFRRHLCAASSGVVFPALFTVATSTLW